MGDTGLLVSHAFDENELLEDEVYKQILAGKLEINEGMLYENAIAQMLVANGHLIVKDGIICIPPYMTMML